MLNLSDFQSFLILILARVRLKDPGLSTFVEKFVWATTIMNLMAIAQFFEVIYTRIFKYLFTVGSIEDDLLEPVSIYYNIVDMNG